MDSQNSNLYIPTGSFSSEKQKILKDAKDKAWAGIPKVAGAVVRDQDPYPSTYLSLSDFQIPRTMPEVFNFCRYFYKFDSLIGGAINALSRFPVTDVIFDDIKNLPENWDEKQDTPILSLYKEVFEDLKIDDELIRIGIDYFLYGNCIIFGELEDKSPDPSVPDIRWSKMFRLDPSRVVIDLDPLTQEKTYKWIVPPKVAKIIRTKKPKDKYDAIPDIIKQAVKENKTVILNKENIYHFSREGESGDGSVWGTPLILNVIKQIAYRNILRQAQEAIAREHLVPFRVYYLNPSERFDPAANFSNVASAFADQLQQAAKDPNYKVVSPIPVDVLNLGGQGRALMLTAEIDQLQAEILAGMGVPREFIFGGVSYSAASISLRILENQFLTYRSILLDFLNNFVIKRMAEARQEWVSKEDDGFLPTVKLSDLKMQDDVQQKQLVINLNASNKVSDEYMYNMLGIDPDKMKKQLEAELEDRLMTERKIAMFQADTNLAIRQKEMQLQLQVQNAQMQMQMQAQAAQAQAMNSMSKEEDPKKEEQKPNKNNASSKKDTSKTSSNKDQTKKAVDDTFLDFMEKSASDNTLYIPKILTVEEQAYVDKIAQTLNSMDEVYKDYILGKVSSELKFHLMEKMSSLNPHSLSQSSVRNKDLGQKSELEKIRANIAGNAGNLSSDSNEATTENMMTPMPKILPPRRDTLK